jgi:hypothetical protein
MATADMVKRNLPNRYVSDSLQNGRRSQGGLASAHVNTALAARGAPSAYCSGEHR